MFFFRAYDQVLKVFYAYFLNCFLFLSCLKKNTKWTVYPNKFLKKVCNLCIIVKNTSN